MKFKKHLEEMHNDMPKETLEVLYARCDTAELKNVLKKLAQCKAPDAYTLMSMQVVENELAKRAKN